MAQRANRVTWGLVGVLAVVVLGGGRALIGYYLRSRRIRVGHRPIRQWSLGGESVFIGVYAGRPSVPVAERVCFGPVEVSWPTRRGRLSGL